MIDNKALRAKYNPDGSSLRTNQLELVDMLKVFAAICKKHDIPWWLGCGTLLGAARHGGFIPWDDDLDIVMLRKDAKRLDKIMRKMEDKEFVYHSMSTDIEYIHTFTKFRKRVGEVEGGHRRGKYFKWRGPFIDIWAIEKTTYFSARTASTICNNLQHLTSYIRCGWVRKPAICAINLYNYGIVIPLLRLIGLINPKGEYHYALGSGWSRAKFFENDIFPLTTANFEGEEFPVPKDMDAYLTHEYGDWRKLPTEEQIRKSIHNPEYIKEIYGEDKPRR